MKKSFLLRDFLKMSLVVFENKASFILTSLTGNKSFPKPTPTLKVLETALAAYSDALMQASSGDKTKRAEREALRTELERILLELMDYVTFEARGDKAKLVSSGYTVNSDTKKQSRPPAELTRVKVMQGQSTGEIAISLPSVKGAKSYVFYYGPLPIVNNSWQSKPGDTNTCVIAGLTRGTEYAVYVAVVLPNKKTLISQPIHIIVT